MNKRAKVFNHNLFAGILEKTDQGEYIFTYDGDYLNNTNTYPICLSMPKTKQPFRSSSLFPFFFGLLSEGTNKQTQCNLLKIDEKDHFSLLLKTANTDTIGSVTINEIKS